MKGASVKDQTINILDHGYVRFIDSMGSDLSITRAARVSYDADWREGGDDTKLLRYMLKNKHTSPFESVTVTFEIKAPIFVFRQWHRHRTQSYNEVSARYTELPAEWYLPEVETIGKQSSTNKQGRDLIDMPAHEIAMLHDGRRLVQQHCEAAYALYQNLLESGWPRELARGVLPFFMYSRMFVTANLHNWLGFLTLRNHSHAQWETQQYAKAVQTMLHNVVPQTMAIWEEIRRRQNDPR